MCIFVVKKELYLAFIALPWSVLEFVAVFYFVFRCLLLSFECLELLSLRLLSFSLLVGVLLLEPLLLGLPGDREALLRGILLSSLFFTFGWRYARYFSGFSASF